MAQKIFHVCNKCLIGNFPNPKCYSILKFAENGIINIKYQYRESFFKYQRENY